MIIDSLYVSVKDMKRAIGFYKKLFQNDPKHVEDRYSYFLVGKISFGLYCPEVDGEKMKIGNNCVVNFRVKDIEAEYKRVKKFTKNIDKKIQIYGSVSLFQFKDSEGNTLETYSD